MCGCHVRNKLEAKKHINVQIYTMSNFLQAFRSAIFKYEVQELDNIYLCVCVCVCVCYPVVS